MPVGAVLVLHTDQELPEATLVALRTRLLRDFDRDLEPDDFFYEMPLVRVDDPDLGPVPRPELGGHWTDLHITGPFYGPGYERGDLPLFIALAEWLEAHVPGATIWYGNDISDDRIGPFDAAERREARAYYDRVGGSEPYHRRHERRSRLGRS